MADYTVILKEDETVSIEQHVIRFPCKHGKMVFRAGANATAIPFCTNIQVGIGLIEFDVFDVDHYGKAIHKVIEIKHEDQQQQPSASESEKTDDESKPAVLESMTPVKRFINYGDGYRGIVTKWSKPITRKRFGGFLDEMDYKEFEQDHSYGKYTMVLDHGLKDEERLSYDDKDVTDDNKMSSVWTFITVDPYTD